jgi:hypothetical protein
MLLERLLHHCPACGGELPQYIEHIMRECQRWEYHRRNFGTLALEFDGFVRQLATSPEDINALLLVGFPLPFMAPLILQEWEVFSVMAQSLASYCVLCSLCIAPPKCFAP